LLAGSKEPLNNENRPDSTHRLSDSPHLDSEGS
jgi:hypothetical protein